MLLTRFCRSPKLESRIVTIYIEPGSSILKRNVFALGYKNMLCIQRPYGVLVHVSQRRNVRYILLRAWPQSVPLQHYRNSSHFDSCLRGLWLLTTADRLHSCTSIPDQSGGVTQHQAGGRRHCQRDEWVHASGWEGCEKLH